MSLIKCPICNHQISDGSSCCTICGFQITSSDSVAAVAYSGNRSERNNAISFPRTNDSWNVELQNIGNKKILAIKITRELFNLDLSDTKNIIEQSRIIVARNLALEDAERLTEEYKINGIEARIFKEE